MTRAEALKLVPKPSAASVNGGRNACKASTLRKVLGEPRPAKDYGTDCKPITNPAIKKDIVTEDVGPFRLTGHRRFLAMCRAAFAALKAEHPDVYALVGSMGCLCCRLVRGSKTSVSNHSWGTALDITIGGTLDTRGDDKVQAGLLVVYSVFKRFGFYWGVEFSVEDGMHLEASNETVLSWAK